MKITKELEQILTTGIGFLRTNDIKLGAMDENYEPANHLLSAEENKKCWVFLAAQYVLNMLNAYSDGKVTNISEPDVFYDDWLMFLQAVENVVRYGQKNKGIENIVNSSGISRETFIKFLD